MFYRTQDNDRLDKLCQQYYGRVEVVPDVLEANPLLSEYPALLPAGLIIKLPEVVPKQTHQDTIQLWD